MLTLEADHTVHTAVRVHTVGVVVADRIHIAAAVVDHIVAELQTAAVDHIVAELQTAAGHRTVVGRRTAAGFDRTFAGSKFGFAVGTRWFPCTRTTSRKSTGRSSRSQSSKNRKF